jgi:hypothetical protein
MNEAGTQAAERGQGALQIFRVPEDHGSDKQVETGRSEELVLEGTVAQLTEAVKEGRSSEGIARLALVDTLCSRLYEPL